MPCTEVIKSTANCHHAVTFVPLCACPPLSSLLHILHILYVVVKKEFKGGWVGMHKGYKGNAMMQAL